VNWNREGIKHAAGFLTVEIRVCFFSSSQRWTFVTLVEVEVKVVATFWMRKRAAVSFAAATAVKTSQVSLKRNENPRSLSWPAWPGVCRFFRLASSHFSCAYTVTAFCYLGSPSLSHLLTINDSFNSPSPPFPSLLRHLIAAQLTTKPSPVSPICPHQK